MKKTYLKPEIILDMMEVENDILQVSVPELSVEDANNELESLSRYESLMIFSLN